MLKSHHYLIVKLTGTSCDARASTALTSLIRSRTMRRQVLTHISHHRSRIRYLSKKNREF